MNDELRRRWHAQVTAALVRRVGASRVDDVADAVQEAWLAAAATWPTRGVPARPDAWLFTAAWRKLLDHGARASQRREVAALDDDAAAGARSGAFTASDALFATPPVALADAPFDDDELALLALCAHPALTRETQVTLMLRVAGGLDVPAIAAALLTAEATIAQRLVRAKRTLRDASALTLEPAQVDARVPALLDAGYLLFTAGYVAAVSDPPERRALCREAIRLLEALAATPRVDRDQRPATSRTYGDEPALAALLALLHLQDSRRDARHDATGRTVPLAEQDRTRWDRAAIARGFAWLERAARGDVLTRWHVQAAIAAAHARTFDGTAPDWPHILALYDQLAAFGDDPVVLLNRAVAVAAVHGADAGLAALAMCAEAPALRAHPLLPAVRASFLTTLGRSGEAADETRRAVQRARSAGDRALLEARLARLT